MMAWTDLDTPAQWDVRDADMLVQSFYMLMENQGTDPNTIQITAYATTIFTPQAFINAIWDRQLRFLKDTGLVIKRVSSAVVPETSRYDLPQDWVDTRRLSFIPLPTTQTYALMRSDAYSLDQGLMGWTTDVGDPVAYQESSQPTLKLDIAPAPANPGTLLLTYIGMPTRPSPPYPNFVPEGDPRYYGNFLIVPDEYAPVVLYGALADLLNADGDGHDPKRAQYCETRYAQGVELARLLLEGA